MRRAPEHNDLAPAAKRQATMARFFKLANGDPLPAPREPKHTLLCPYCDVVLESEHKSSLAGNLKIHCSTKHFLEMAESTAMASGVLSIARRTLFDDFEPLPAIAEDFELEQNDQRIGATPTDTVPIKKRFSYSIKLKYRVIKKV